MNRQTGLRDPAVLSGKRVAIAARAVGPLRRVAGSFWARALVSAGLLAIVATQIDFHTVGRRLSGGSWGWFAAAVAALFGSFVIAAVRWYLLLRSAEVGTTPRAALRAYLVGTFTSNFLPSQVGGDVTRAWIAGRPGTRVRSATTVVIDRATALVCLLIVAWLAFASDPGPVPGTLVAALAAAAAAVVAVAFLIALAVRGRARLARWVPVRLQAWSLDARAAARACFRSGVLWRTALLGLSFGALTTLTVWFLAQSISLDASFSLIAVTLPPVLIVSTLPISIAGFGVREGSYALLLGHAGVSTSDATLLSVLSGVAFALASLPGGLALLWRRHQAVGPKEEPALSPPGGADR